jgi:hypothetical protein
LTSTDEFTLLFDDLVQLARQIALRDDERARGNDGSLGGDDQVGFPLLVYVIGECSDAVLRVPLVVWAYGLEWNEEDRGSIREDGIQAAEFLAGIRGGNIFGEGTLWHGRDLTQ